MCNKTAYPDRKTAQTAINTIHNRRVYVNGQRAKSANARNHKTDRPKREYQCPECGQWHLSSKKHVLDFPKRDPDTGLFTNQNRHHPLLKRPKRNPRYFRTIDE